MAVVAVDSNLKVASGSGCWQFRLAQRLAAIVRDPQKRDDGSAIGTSRTCLTYTGGSRANRGRGDGLSQQQTPVSLSAEWF